MLGGNDGNLMLPGFMDANQFQYQTNATNQLQLFKNMAAGCSADPVNYFANENISPMIRPNKCGGEMENNVLRQQKLQISLNYNPNNVQEEVDRSTGIPKQNLVSTGLRLSYDDDERNSSVTSASESMIGAAPPSIFHPLGDNVRIELDRQKDELDRFIKIQAEQMVKGVRDMNQRHVASFLTVIEKGTNTKIQEKDLEIENMNRRNKELVEKIKQAAMEVQNWQYRAKYNESVVNVLKSNLQQAMSQNEGKEGFGDSEIDDAASYIDPNRYYRTGPGGPRLAAMSSSTMVRCRACKAKPVSVLLVPCRHLCLCKECDVFIGVCPVCQLVKTSGVEVFFS